MANSGSSPSHASTETIVRAAVGGGIGVIVIISAIVFIFLRRRIAQGQAQQSNRVEGHDHDQHPTASTLRDDVPDSATDPGHSNSDEDQVLDIAPIGSRTQTPLPIDTRVGSMHRQEKEPTSTELENAAAGPISMGAPFP